MSALAMALLLLTSPGSDVVLYDFSATWCGPCQSMKPTVHRLSSEGYPVQIVDVDRQPQLASQYQVRQVPCFVLVSGGKPVARLTGTQSYQTLKQLLDRELSQRPSAASPNVGQEYASRTMRTMNGPQGMPATPSTESPFTQMSASARSTPAATATPASHQAAPATIDQADQASLQQIAQMAFAASCRLRIEDPDGHSWGSGTVVHAHGKEALIITCGHVFRDSKGKGEISVDFFGPGSLKGLAGQVVSYDLKRDVGLVRIETPYPLTCARVAPVGYVAKQNDTVISIGCPHGNDPEVLASQINSINKFLGPPNLQVAGAPVQGRSGGGLFSDDGLLIGVCNAADPEDDEGLFAALGSVHAILDQVQLSFVYRPELAPQYAMGGSAPARRSAPSFQPASRPSATPQADPYRSASNPPRRESATNPVLGELTPVSAPPQAESFSMPTVGITGEGSEVICIVRSIEDPTGKSQVMVLDRASPEFMEQLSREVGVQNSRHYTSHEGR
ncbi:Thioredoxin [Planctomycetales bacterium 10988]|nr:Thioredoxin [Planctomycetales bacterium 10988]